jgi:hypothetical protein
MISFRLHEVVKFWWSVPVAPIVPLVFLIQVPATTHGQEQLDIGQHPHEDVEANDTADRNTYELGDLVLGLSIH